MQGCIGLTTYGERNEERTLTMHIIEFNYDQVYMPARDAAELMYTSGDPKKLLARYRTARQSALDTHKLIWPDYEAPSRVLGFTSRVNGGRRNEQGERNTDIAEGILGCTVLSVSEVFAGLTALARSRSYPAAWSLHEIITKLCTSSDFQITVVRFGDDSMQQVNVVGGVMDPSLLWTPVSWNVHIKNCLRDLSHKPWFDNFNEQQVRLAHYVLLLVDPASPNPELGLNVIGQVAYNFAVKWKDIPAVPFDFKMQKISEFDKCQLLWNLQDIVRQRKDQVSLLSVMLRYPL